MKAVSRMAKEDLRLAVWGALLELEPRDRLMIILRFGLVWGKECTLDEIGWVLNISRERVRQRVFKILRRLHHPIMLGNREFLELLSMTVSEPIEDDTIRDHLPMGSSIESEQSQKRMEKREQCWASLLNVRIPTAVPFADHSYDPSLRAAYREKTLAMRIKSLSPKGMPR